MKYPPITLELLRSKKACQSQLVLFQKYFGDSPVTLTEEIFTKFSSKFDISWASRNLLYLKDLTEYLKVRDTAYAVYEKVRDAYWSEYLKVTAPTWDEYNEALVEEYEKVRGWDYSEYQKVRDAAWDEYQKVSEPASAKYKKVIEPAYAEYHKVNALTFLKLYTA